MKTIFTKGQFNPIIYGYGNEAKQKFHQLAKVNGVYNQQTTHNNPWKPIKGIMWNADQISFKDLSGKNSLGLKNYIDAKGYLHLSNCCKNTHNKLIAFITTQKPNINGKQKVVYTFEGVFRCVNCIPDPNIAGKYEHIYQLVSSELIEL